MEMCEPLEPVIIVNGTSNSISLHMHTDKSECFRGFNMTWKISKSRYNSFRGDQNLQQCSKICFLQLENIMIFELPTFILKRNQKIHKVAAVKIVKLMSLHYPFITVLYRKLFIYFYMCTFSIIRYVCMRCYFKSHMYQQPHPVHQHQ